MAIECHRRSARAEGSSGGEGGGGRAREGVIHPLLKGARGISPEKIFEFNMSVEAILMHFVWQAVLLFIRKCRYLIYT